MPTLKKKKSVNSKPKLVLKETRKKNPTLNKNKGNFYKR